MIALMTNETKKNRQITDENRSESAKLRQLWHDRKNLHNLSQSDFGHQYGVGTQAAVSACLNGTMAISLKAATGFAQGLRCNVSEFSPRLAALSGAVTQTTLNALISDLAPQLATLKAANQPYCPSKPSTIPSDYAAMLTKVFDCLPDNEDIRTQVFMACVHIIRTAGITPQSGPPAPTPWRSETVEMPS